MKQFNIQNNNLPETNYQNGLLPQRNKKNLYYRQTSCRSNLKNFLLSSENRRILKKTQNYSCTRLPLSKLKYDLLLQKKLSFWVKQLGWDFPTSSIKNIFTRHLFNFVYIWKDEQKKIIAYSLCYFSSQISHIAYVFYQPELSHSNLPIRLTLQVIIDSQKLGLKFCYLGRFSPDTGYYKRNMPGFEIYDYKKNIWIPYKK